MPYEGWTEDKLRNHPVLRRSAEKMDLRAVSAKSPVPSIQTQDGSAMSPLGISNNRAQPGEYGQENAPASDNGLQEHMKAQQFSKDNLFPGKYETSPENDQKRRSSQESRLSVETSFRVSPPAGQSGPDPALFRVKQLQNHFYQPRFAMDRFAEAPCNPPLNILDPPQFLADAQVTEYPGFRDVEKALVEGHWVDGSLSCLQTGWIDAEHVRADGPTMEATSAPPKMQNFPPGARKLMLSPTKGDAGVDPTKGHSAIEASVNKPKVGKYTYSLFPTIRPIPPPPFSTSRPYDPPPFPPPNRPLPELPIAPPNFSNNDLPSSPLPAHSQECFQFRSPDEEDPLLSGPRAPLFSHSPLTTPTAQPSTNKSPAKLKRGHTLNLVNPIALKASQDDPWTFTVEGLAHTLSKLYHPASIPNDVIRALPNATAVATLNDPNSPKSVEFKNMLEINKGRVLMLNEKEACYLSYYVDTLCDRNLELANERVGMEAEANERREEAAEAQAAVSEILSERLGFRSNADAVVLRWKMLETAVKQQEGGNGMGNEAQFLAKELGKDLATLVQTAMREREGLEREMKAKVKKERDDAQYWRARAQAAEMRIGAFERIE
ncbi:hypothetical protein GQ43DRAFT_49704 [Delitschia confertaspora ATCC 74209]|uniref:Uncharacterized protein n=1 Tax=Delitschia confertaspora ATCC 74209 TaxID=1513339 RepID=A0A9P4MWJ5_9PLEO|nr:hypothetical protein GQ43DRAFT_49704 [Delitschia confertaspora ATCC 74209]